MDAALRGDLNTMRPLLVRLNAPVPRRLSWMQALLGVVPLTDREGCLQDIHWTWPSFGYFPTYALGNFYAAQLYQAALVQNPTLAQEIAAGDFSGLLDWMHRQIHQHGRKLAPADLIQPATGRPLSHEAFVRYVTEKFSEIYQL